MPRAIWTGAISFGLVNVPVRMYSAIEEHKLHFNYIHEKDGSRIGYEKVCKTEEQARPRGRDRQGVRVGEGRVRPDARRGLREGAGGHATRRSTSATSSTTTRSIPIFFERTYYLGPQDGAEKVYALLVRAMEESGRAAIAKFVMRDRQHLGCLRVSDGALLLEKMYFADEIRDADGDQAEGQEGRHRQARGRDGPGADRQAVRAVQAGAVRGHLPRHALRDHQGEARGRDDRGAGAREAEGRAEPDGGAQGEPRAGGGEQAEVRRRNGGKKKSKAKAKA